MIHQGSERKTKTFLIPLFSLIPLYCFVLINFISDLNCEQHNAVQYVNPLKFFLPHSLFNQTLPK